MEDIETSLENRMLIDTLGALGNGTTVTISPEHGMLLLEGWLNALRGDEGADRIVSELAILRDELKSGYPDSQKVSHLLLDLATHTEKLANEYTVSEATTYQLHQLVVTLRNFASQF